jgi:hypothetical protein
MCPKLCDDGETVTPLGTQVARGNKRSERGGFYQIIRWILVLLLVCKGLGNVVTFGDRGVKCSEITEAFKICGWFKLTIRRSCSAIGMSELKSHREHFSNPSFIFKINLLALFRTYFLYIISWQWSNWALGYRVVPPILAIKNTPSEQQSFVAGHLLRVDPRSALSYHFNVCLHTSFENKLSGWRLEKYFFKFLKDT